MKIFILFVFILFLQFSFSQVDSTINNCTQIPDGVIKYINNNFPDYDFPDANWYEKIHMDSTSRFFRLYKMNENIPPYYACGDFNGNGFIDYILHIGKGKVGKDTDSLYEYKYILLHGSKEGFKSFPFLFNQTYGGDVEYLESKLMTISAQELINTFSEKTDKLKIKYTLFVFASHMSVNCFYWYGKKYAKINLHAD